jgi:D-glycero-D-manno-heptose 1,7-bisphosphate phosphatase
MNRRRFVLLDRDGTINVERHYLSRPAQVELLPGALEGLRSLRRLGLGLAVVTNQSGVGRGYFDESALDAVHERLRDLLQAGGVELDGVYSCPHLPADGCGCRKPQPGLARLAAADLGFDPSEAFVIGDKPCDVELGRRLGAATLLVRTGYGNRYPVGAVRPDHVADDLADAARTIEALLEGERRRAM